MVNRKKNYGKMWANKKPHPPVDKNHMWRTSFSPNPNRVEQPRSIDFRNFNFLKTDSAIEDAP